MGLLRGVARTAAVAGTATVVSNRVSRRQQTRWAQKDAQNASTQQSQYAEPQYAQPQYAAPAPAPTTAAPSSDLVEQLQQLSQLREQGVLSDDEFAAAKAKLIGR
jgi:predicted cobalt transporter CbtA